MSISSPSIASQITLGCSSPPSATSNSVSKNEPATAPTEIAALALRERNPPKPMSTAENSGSNKMSHAAMFIVYSFIVAKSSTSAV